MQSMQRIPRRHYMDDFKAQAVTLASSIEQAQAVRKRGMPVKTLSHWVEAGECCQIIEMCVILTVMAWSRPG
jgi:transposase-like protein